MIIVDDLKNSTILISHRIGIGSSWETLVPRLEFVDCPKTFSELTNLANELENAET